MWLAVASIFCLLLIVLALGIGALLLQLRIEREKQPAPGFPGFQGPQGITGDRGGISLIPGTTGPTGPTGVFTSTGPQGGTGSGGPTGPWPSLTSQPYVSTNGSVSTGTTSGALIVSGGVGVGKNLFVGGITHVGRTLLASGGFHGFEQLNADKLGSSANTSSTLPTNGALVVAGGVDIDGDVDANTIRVPTLATQTGLFLYGVNIPQFHARGLTGNWVVPATIAIGVPFNQAVQVIGSTITWDSTNHVFNLALPGRYFVSYTLTSTTDMSNANPNLLVQIITSDNVYPRGVMQWQQLIDAFSISAVTSVYITQPNQTLTIQVFNPGPSFTILGDPLQTMCAIQYDARNETSY